MAKRRSAGVAVVVALVVGGVALLAARAGDDPVPPGIVGTQPVWYDAAGLHHGDAVERTAVELVREPDEENAVLALVRGGAVYDDPATGDVWFHPWGGDPRIVGQQTGRGPGGDPDSDVAAWFEEDELVVYDTARDAEISRTVERPVTRERPGEHVPGNGFLHVSPEEVVWRSAVGVHRLDLATGTTSALYAGAPTGKRRLEDVHEGTDVWADYVVGTLRIRVDGRDVPRRTALQPAGRLSPDGAYVLSPWKTGSAQGVSFVDASTGEGWQSSGPAWNVWMSWSYGDVAVLHVEPGTAGRARLMACYAAARVCDELPVRGGVLLPAS